MIIGENAQIDGSLEIWTSATITSSGIVSANTFRDYNYSGGFVLVSNTNKDLVESSITSAEINFLDTVSANIQSQLSNLSGTKVDKTTTITAGTMLSGGGDLSTNRTISHQTVGTSGTYSNIVTNSTGHITSARALISADIPTLPATKILEDANDRFVSDTQINSWTGTTTTVHSNSANWNTAFTSAHTHSNKSTLDLINQSLNTSATVAFSQIDLGKGVNIGATGNTDWLHIASFPKTDSNISRKYYVTLMGGDWADNAKIEYVFDSFGSTGSSSAFDIGRIYSSWINSNSEIYSNIEFKTLRNNSTNVYDVYVRGTSVDFFTLAADVKYTNGGNGAFQFYVQTSANASLPTSATHTELVTTVREQPTRMLNDILFVRNVNLTRNSNFSYTDTSAVGDFRFDGSGFYPQTNYDLGTDAKRWNNIYGLSANIGNISATSITVGNIDNTEFQYLNGTSANIQTQLSNMSATKANTSVTITAGTMLSGGGDISTNRTISHQTVGTAGTYSNIVTNSTGHITSARALISADIPTLPATKIGTGIISDTEFNYLDGVSANIQTQINQLSQLAVSGNGAGTPNVLTKFVTSASMGNSTITDTGSLVTFTTPVSSNNTITAPNFTGLASRATSALQADTLKTARSFSLSGEVTSINVPTFNGSGNIVLSAVIASGIDATKIADGSVTSTEFQYINSLSANAQTQLTNLSATKLTLGANAGGDLGGTYPNPTVLKVAGVAVALSQTGPLCYNGSTIQALANISADSYTNNNFVGSRVLVSNTQKQIDESSISTTTLSNLVTSAHSHTNKSTLDLINQSLNTSANATFNSVHLTSNGQATNVRIGDDIWIGDITQPNTMSIRGVQSSAVGYVRFGTDTNSIGYNGSTLVYGNNKVWTSADFSQTNIDSWKNSRVGQGTYSVEDSLSLSARNSRGINFGRMFNNNDAPTSGDYWNYIQMPETPVAFSQTLIAQSTTNNDVYFGRGSWNAVPTWVKAWTSNDFTSTNITNWNTAFTSAHSHTNKSTLDLINQSLNTSATISADKIILTNNGLGTNVRIGDDSWLGDINISNTMSLRGVQSSASGYIRFGSDTNSFGYDGSRLTYTGTLSSNNITIYGTFKNIGLSGFALFDNTTNNLYSYKNATSTRQFAYTNNNTVGFGGINYYDILGLNDNYALLSADNVFTGENIFQAYTVFNGLTSNGFISSDKYIFSMPTIITTSGTIPNNHSMATISAITDITRINMPSSASEGQTLIINCVEQGATGHKLYANNNTNLILYTDTNGTIRSVGNTGTPANYPIILTYGSYLFTYSDGFWLAGRLCQTV